MANKIYSQPILVILGATGTGKSNLAVDLAKRFNGEIINCDAMQMYSGLPIITNKITHEEQQGIPHHLLGNIQLEEEAWRVGVFQKEAKIIIQQIRSRGKTPVVVGGTHYYIHSLLFGDSIVGEEKDGTENLQPFEANKDTNCDLSILDGPPGPILEKLKEVDPVMAGRWHPNDVRKISRSLEIFLKTGEKASDLYARQQERREVNDCLQIRPKSVGVTVDPESTLLFWIHADTETLKTRLDARVLKMIKVGLLDEIKSMDQYLEKQQAAGVEVDKTRGIWASIGWKEFEPFLKALKTGVDLGKGLDLSIQQTQAATRQYAKRQLRWIRLKLRPALVQYPGWNDRLYLLDGTKVSDFQENVVDVAIKITSDFLDGKKLALPVELSSIAKSVLSSEEKKPNVWFRKTCETCGITSMNEIEWEAHLKSRKHRGLKRASLKKNRNPRPTI